MILAPIVFLNWPTGAGLVIEPSHDRVAGSGPSDKAIPIYDPTYIVNGVPYALSNKPGEKILYAAGDPTEPVFSSFYILNNTQYKITGFHLKIVGPAASTDDPGTIQRGNVDAVFGDLNGDGRIGKSDIFKNITVSADKKEMTFSDGVIPVGGRFTDVHLARSAAPPQFVGIEATFTGVKAVPLPLGAFLAAAGLPMAGYVARKWNKRL
jgi:hypothetical protein